MPQWMRQGYPSAASHETFLETIDRILAENEIAQQDDDSTAGFTYSIEHDRSFT